jgi:hypothetical protein
VEGEALEFGMEKEGEEADMEKEEDDVEEETGTPDIVTAQRWDDILSHCGESRLRSHPAMRPKQRSQRALRIVSV